MHVLFTLWFQHHLSWGFFYSFNEAECNLWLWKLLIVRCQFVQLAQSQAVNSVILFYLLFESFCTKYRYKVWCFRCLLSPDNACCALSDHLSPLTRETFDFSGKHKYPVSTHLGWIIRPFLFRPNIPQIIKTQMLVQMVHPSACNTQKRPNSHFILYQITC